MFSIAETTLKSSKLLAAMALTIGLAACQSAPVPPAGLASTPQPAIATAPITNPDNVTFAFEPITGMPGNKADEMSSELGTVARNVGLNLVRRVNATATYRVNGYLSATGDTSSTTVFYVFDIVDAAGKRVKRLQGSETIGGSAGDPWSVVDTGTLNRIAQRTAVEIDAWLNKA